MPETYFIFEIMLWVDTIMLQTKEKKRMEITQLLLSMIEPNKGNGRIYIAISPTVTSNGGGGGVGGVIT